MSYFASSSKLFEHIRSLGIYNFAKTNKLQIQTNVGPQGQVWIKRRGRLIEKIRYSSNRVVIRRGVINFVIVSML